MLNRLLFRLAGRLPCRLISLDSGPYLERYYLGTLLGVTFYLHRFVSSDSERHVHNHPWKYGAAVILAGGYTEERLVDMCPDMPEGYIVRFIKRRWFNVVNGKTFHRIHDAKPGTWTLFLHGPRQCIGNWPADMQHLGLPRKPKGWGFLERETLGQSGHVTVFYPMRSGAAKWWKDAPLGNASERAPL